MSGAIKPLIIIGSVAALVILAIVAPTMGVYNAVTSDKVCISEPSIQAMCIHLNEKYGYGIPMKECKARQPYRASTPAARY